MSQRKVMRKEQFFHFRLADEKHLQNPDGYSSKFEAKGGATGYYRPLEGNRSVLGISLCMPNDNFNKEKGRSEAYGNAEKALGCNFVDQISDLMTYEEAREKCLTLVKDLIMETVHVKTQKFEDQVSKAKKDHFHMVEQFNRIGNDELAPTKKEKEVIEN